MRAFRLIGLAALVAVSASAQPYVHSLTLKIKPGTAPALGAAMKKMAEANQKNNGPTWVAAVSAFGESDKVVFLALRESLAAQEEAGKAFNQAMLKAVGPEGYAKIGASIAAITVDGRNDLLRLRPKLGYNAPSDKDGILKQVGQARWIRRTAIRLKPGTDADFTEIWNKLKEMMEKSGSKEAIGVSTSMTGPPVMYFTSYAKSLGDWDVKPPVTTPSAAQAAEYRALLRKGGELLIGAETEIFRMTPALSNPAKEIIDCDPEFWKPKPPAPPAPKAAPPAKK